MNGATGNRDQNGRREQERGKGGLHLEVVANSVHAHGALGRQWVGDDYARGGEHVVAQTLKLEAPAVRAQPKVKHLRGGEGVMGVGGVQVRFTREIEEIVCGVCGVCSDATAPA